MPGPNSQPHMVINGKKVGVGKSRKVRETKGNSISEDSAPKKLRARLKEYKPLGGYKRPGSMK